MKRKGGINNNGAQKFSNVPGYTNVMNSPFKTPMSSKGGRTHTKSKVSKEEMSYPQTPISNAGENIFSLSFMLKCLTKFTVCFRSF